MDAEKRERWGAASGYQVVLLGIVGAAFAILLGCALLAPSPTFAAAAPSATTANPSRAAGSPVVVDADYAQALQAANLFLWAWQTCNSDLGLLLISRPLQARLEQPPSRTQFSFELYMEGLSNPHHLAFEITGGKPLGPTRIAFTVALFDHYQGEPQAVRYDSTVELVLEPDAPPAPDPSLMRRLTPEAASHFRITEALRWKVDVLPQAR